MLVTRWLHVGHTFSVLRSGTGCLATASRPCSFLKLYIRLKRKPLFSRFSLLKIARNDRHTAHFATF
nr:MAG TPA: hypothetical protein [Caudoviricetes sp.]